MIDVHGAKCNTPCNYGLKYPCLLNNLWDRFNKTSPNYLPFNLTEATYPSGSWTKPYGSSGYNAYNFAVPAKIEEEAVMFIGMNPSYIPSNSNNNYYDYWKNGKTVNNIPVQLSDSIDSTTGWQFEEFYNPKSYFYYIDYFKDIRKFMYSLYEYMNGKFCLKKEEEIKTNIASEKIIQFKYPNEVAGNTQLKYSHLDLLFIRETKQKNIETIVKNWNTNKELGNFIRGQINIFKDLLERSNPKVIIVNNAFVSKIFRNDSFYFQNYTLSQPNDDFQGLRRHLNMPLRWDRNNETYMWYNPKAQKEIPVFLLGMTTGGSFDLGSRERLIAQVAKFI